MYLYEFVASGSVNIKAYILTIKVMHCAQSRNSEPMRDCAAIEMRYMHTCICIRICTCMYTICVEICRKLVIALIAGCY